MKKVHFLFVIFIILVISGCVNPGNNDFPSLDNMIKIIAGSFNMGDTLDQGDEDEKPVHEVTITYDYYIGKFEITNREYCAFLNNAGVSSNGSKDGKELIDMDDENCQIGHNGTKFYVKNNLDNYPIIEVTWWGAIYFCNWFSNIEGLTASYNLDTGELIDYPANKGIRLPTEAEWEYAARGAANNPDYLYAGSDNIDEVAWYWINSENPDNPIYFGKGSHEVGLKNPNALGTYDMSGNVYEWCTDWYGEDYYASSTLQNPTGPSIGSNRITRGGTWYGNYNNNRLGNRFNKPPTYSGWDFGFRICRSE